MQDELAEVLSEATLALTQLDADALDDLEQRALRLQSFVRGVGSIASAPEIEARFRVFSDVVRATGENLRVIESVVPGRQRISGKAAERFLWVR